MSSSEARLRWRRSPSCPLLGLPEAASRRFQACRQRRGQAGAVRRAEERTREGRKGKERKGAEWRREERRGEERRGEEKRGKERRGEERKE